MKKITRRSFLQAMLSASAGAALTSCADKAASGSTNNNAESASDTGAGQTALERLESQKELTVLFVAGNFPESLEGIYGDYENEYGVKVNYTVLGVDTYFQKMLVELSSGSDAYDLIYLMNAQFLQYATNDWLYPLDDLIADKTITDDSLLDLDTLMPSSLESQYYNDKLYGIPVSSLTCLLYWRKDLFEAAGLDPEQPPKTWDELEEYAAILHSENISGVAMRGERSVAGSEGLIWHWPMVMYSMGGDFVKSFPEDMTPTLNTPETIASVDYYANLLQNYSIKGATTCNYEEITVAVQQGDLAMWIDGAAIVRNYINPETSNTREEDVGYSSIPGGPMGITAPLGTHSINIPANAKHKERAWHFIQWSTSHDTLVRLSTEGNLVAVSRKTVFDDPTFQEINNIGGGAWLQAMNKTLSEDAVALYRPHTPEWPEVADLVSGYISDVLTGQMDSTTAMNQANEELTDLYKEAGYI